MKKKTIDLQFMKAGFNAFNEVMTYVSCNRYYMAHEPAVREYYKTQIYEGFENAEQIILLLDTVRHIVTKEVR